MNSQERLKQLRLQIDPFYSEELNICIWRLDGDFGLTPYGHKRARVCEGGHDGCSGEVTIVEIKNDDFTYKAPRCKNCQIHKERNDE